MNDQNKLAAMAVAMVNDGKPDSYIIDGLLKENTGWEPVLGYHDEAEANARKLIADARANPEPKCDKAEEIIASPILYSRGNGARDNTPNHRQAADFATFRDACLSDVSQRKGMGWIACAFERAPDDDTHKAMQGGKHAVGKPHRCKACARPRRFIGLDVDHGLTAETFHALIVWMQPFSAFAYTTANSTHEAPRCRLVFELDREAGRDDAQRATWALQGRIARDIEGIRFDKTCDRSEQPLYLPTVGAQTYYSEASAPLSLTELLGEAVTLRDSCDHLPAPTPALRDGSGVVIAEDRHGDVLKLAAKFARLVHSDGVARDTALAAMADEAARGRWTRDVPSIELTQGFDGALGKLQRGEWSTQAPLAPPHNRASPETGPATQLRPGWRLQPIGELLAQPSPTRWLLRGIVDCEACACIFGAPGSGKSFLAVDTAACIATGTPWHDHKVLQGAVVYLAGEGHHGLRKRFLAWSIARGVDLKVAPLFLSPAAIDLTGSQADIIAAIKAACGDASPVLVIVDTLHRHLRPGANENTGEDVGPFLAAADSIRQAFACAVILVHHTGHTAAERERGWSGIRGAVDWSYSVVKGDGGPIILQCRKAKDHEEPDEMQFALESVTLPWLDDEGEPEQSAALCVSGATAAGMGANQLIAMTTLRKLLESANGEPVTTVAKWRNASGIDRKRWPETLASLCARGLVLVDGDLARLPNGTLPTSDRNTLLKKGCVSDGTHAAIGKPDVSDARMYRFGHSDAAVSDVAGVK